MKKTLIFIVLIIILGVFAFYLYNTQQDSDLSPSINQKVYCSCLVGDIITKGDIKLSDGKWHEPCEAPDGKPGHLVRTSTCLKVDDSCVKMKRNAIILDGLWGPEAIKCVLDN